MTKRLIDAAQAVLDDHLIEYRQRNELKGALDEARQPSYASSLNEIADVHFAWLCRVGFTGGTDLEQLMLIVSEAGEAANECRGPLPTEEFGTELADIVLRTLGLAKRHDIDIAGLIAKKMVINEENGTRGRVI